MRTPKFFRLSRLWAMMMFNTEELPTILSPTSTHLNSKLLSWSYHLFFSNAVFLTQDSETLCYDRKTPNGEFRVRERIVKSLPSQPKTYTINVFDLNQLNEKEEKVKTLQEQFNVPLVADKVNLDVAGF